MPEVATTGSERAPLTKIRLRPRYISRASLSASRGKSASPAACSSSARSTRGRSLSFSRERKGLVEGPRSNGGFSSVRTEPAPFREMVLLPRSPDPIDHGKEGNGPSLPRFLSALLWELQVEELPELIRPASLLFEKEE
eukprot:2267586-Amphidinium_carterae.1